jgi:predicted nucleic acid-binding protein
MIVLDTTVLVYSKGADHELREPCRSLVAAIATGRIEATTSVEVIQEFVYVRARRRDRIDAASMGRDYVDLLAPLLTVSGSEVRAGLALFESVDRLGAFDAVLAAGAIAAGAAALVSADNVFGDVPGLVHVVPDAAGVNRLLNPQQSAAT